MKSFKSEIVCLVDSISPKPILKQFITDLQDDQACLKATEEASNNVDEVIGIASVDIAAMKMKSTRPEPNGTRSRTLAQPNAGKTDKDAYKSIVGTISDTAQKHALSSKAINNALPLAIKQKPHTFKQQKPLKLSPKPHLLEQARKTSARPESIEEIFGEEFTEGTFVTTKILPKTT